MAKRILFLTNHYVSLYNLRKELIQILCDEGHEVFVSSPESKGKAFFEGIGCKIVDTPMEARGTNPVKDFRLIRKYVKIMKEVNPDIIFSYTIKPNIYGSIASNKTKHRQVVNITGTGGTFLKKSFVSEIIKILYKASIKKSYKVFFQNTSDKDFFVKNNMVSNNYEMLPGSGVNLNRFVLSDFPSDEKVNFIFIGRVMKLKGIDEYIEMAKQIKIKHPKTNFYVAGYYEEDHYKDMIEENNDKGIIKYIGYQKDIKPWIEKCHCTILPSHGGEGIPNVLLESAAMGRVCIATNASGSKDVIDDGVTGYLFEPGNAEDLISKVEKFLSMGYKDKKQMGLAGREKVEREFDRQIVIEKYLDEINNFK